MARVVSTFSKFTDTTQLTVLFSEVILGRQILNLKTRVRFPVALPNLPVSTKPP